MTPLGRLRTFAALGLSNVARVGLYRLGLRSGLHPVQRISAAVAEPPFFSAPLARDHLPAANTSWRTMLHWYDWMELDHDGSPPDWFATPFTSGERYDSDEPWWRIRDFANHDIKDVWELSRFAWLVAMATEAASGEVGALDRINAWLESWAAENPPYRGPNWKCGQETSIRVLHLTLAAMVLSQDNSPLPSLVGLIEAHLRRIAPTLSDAIGQQNNHGTSEAAALFVGGDFLARAGIAEGQKWASKGRRLLEHLALALIEEDGSFSQYSVTYHRLMLDTYCFVEAWRRRHGLSPFSDACLTRLRAATDWLDAIVDRESGDAPNIGANDGARLLPLTARDYRDFRPSLQLASSLFRNGRAIGPAGSYDALLRWLGVGHVEAVRPPPVSKTFDCGGYHVLRAGSALAVLRYPRFRFRPSQADALHLDLWVGGRNILRDGGTYSYNDATGLGTFLAGTAAHNTVCFDGRDQMPRLGRFLFGDWLKSAKVQSVSSGRSGYRAAAAYLDRRGTTHEREIRLSQNELTCLDTVGGPFVTAILRWRLAPGDYKLENGVLRGEDLEMMISAAQHKVNLTLTEGPESRHYRQCTQIPVLEARISHPDIVTTRLRIGPALGNLQG